MAQTAGQLLGQAVPVCQWIPQNTLNTTSTIPAYPRFPDNVREWIGFFRAVRLAGTQFPFPGGQFPGVGATNAIPLRVEDDAKTRLRDNVLSTVGALIPQGAGFVATPAV
ncbi:hypothetical protein RhiirA1_430173, partial [Rhizophagus irregularis]